MADRSLSPGAQALQLATAATTARSGAPLPWDDSSHRARCLICRDHPELLDELEARYLNWSPAAELALEFGIGEQALRTHAACYLWDLRRCAELAPAYSQLIESGVKAAREGQATPTHALQALRDLQKAARRSASVSDPGDEQAGTRQLVESAGGAVVLSYEEKVRRVRAELTGGADPAQVVAQLAQVAQAAQLDEAAQLPGDPQLDGRADPRPDDADALAHQLDDVDRQASALLDLGDRTRTSRRRAAAHLVRSANDDRPGRPR